MDGARKVWHFPDMMTPRPLIPVWTLYGESGAFPDILHVERITDRAAGLDWRIAPHRHRALHQFFLIQSGAARLTLDGQSIAPHPPFVLSVPAGVVHDFSFAAGTDGFVLTIPLQSLPDLFDPGSATGAGLSHPSHVPADPELSALFTAIFAEHSAAAPMRAPLLRAMASQLACLLLRRRADATATAEGADPRLARFATQIRDHLRDGWRVADHARALGLSERHLSRLCHAAYGQAASAVMADVIMREACRMLAYTRASVAEIGYTLGFDDPSYFSRAFRRVTGQAPAAYRAGLETAAAGPPAAISRHRRKSRSSAGERSGA